MILSLQYLRGIAALMVVYFHVGTQIDRVGGQPLVLNDAGRFGVDIFFVISGAVMWVTTRDGRTDPGTFLTRRLVRIAPLYWAVTLFVALVALGAPRLQSSTAFDPGHILASLLFLPWPHPVVGGYSPVVIPGWTLNYEMMFYLVFATALLLPLRIRAVATCAVLVLIVLVGHAARLGGALGFYADPIVLEFGLGILVGALYAGRLRIPPALCIAAAVFGTALLLGFDQFPGLPHLPAVGLPVALIVGGLVLYDKARPLRHAAILSRIGDASYSIYLSHIVVLPVVRLVWSKLQIGAAGPGAVAFYATAVLASVLVGFATWRWVELPLTSWARRLVSTGRSAVPIA